MSCCIFLQLCILLSPLLQPTCLATCPAMKAPWPEEVRGHQCITLTFYSSWWNCLKFIVIAAGGYLPPPMPAEPVAPPQPGPVPDDWRWDLTPPFPHEPLSAYERWSDRVAFRGNILIMWFSCVFCSIPSLSEDVAQAAFKSFASSNCCWSAAPAEDGVITSMEPFNTYRVSWGSRSLLC